MLLFKVNAKWTHLLRVPKFEITDVCPVKLVPSADDHNSKLLPSELGPI